MTISIKRLNEATNFAWQQGYLQGKKDEKEKLETDVKLQLLQNKSTLVQDAAALAHANAKLTYALGQILLNLGKS